MSGKVLDEVGVESDFRGAQVRTPGGQCPDKRSGGACSSRHRGFGSDCPSVDVPILGAGGSGCGGNWGDGVWVVSDREENTVVLRWEAGVPGSVDVPLHVAESGVNFSGGLALAEAPSVRGHVVLEARQGRAQMHWLL